MAKLLIVLTLAGLVLAIVGIVYGVKAWNARNHRRYLARYAPDLLDHDGKIDPEIAELIVEQRREIEAKDKSLAAIQDIATQLLIRPESYMLGEQLGPIQQWLGSRTKRKEIEK